jgi:hypothetical protein
MREGLMLQRYMNDAVRAFGIAAKEMNNVKGNGRKRVDLPNGGYIIYDYSTGTVLSEVVIEGKHYFLQADNIGK